MFLLNLFRVRLCASDNYIHSMENATARAFLLLFVSFLVSAARVLISVIAHMLNNMLNIYIYIYIYIVDKI